MKPPGPNELLNVPLFPLPNVVLFPRAVLPLHVFEPRYRQMTAHALASDKRIAMALLRDGWQQEYHGRPAIFDVVCVGRIIGHEMLDDGRYNLLLQGETRARVVEEDFDLAYRRARLEPLREVPAFDVDLAPLREDLAGLLSASRLATTDLGRELAKVVRSAIPTAQLVDVCAFSLLDDVALKQSLLAEPDVRTRVARAFEGLQQLYPAMPTTLRRFGGVNPN